MMDTDYRLERRLDMLDANLHRRYKDCVLTSQAMLTHYQSVFPEYTDHTILHTMNVVVPLSANNSRRFLLCR